VPASELARKYLVSDVGLTKLCRRLGVPKPGRGYWATPNPGKRAKRAPLPEPIAGAATEVVLHTRTIPTAALRPQQTDLIVKVPKTLAHPHPLVARTASAFKSARPENDGRVAARGEGVLAITVSPESSSRALLAMDTLTKEVERRGHRVEVSSDRARATMVVVGSERIEVSLRERLLQVKRPQGDSSHSLWSSRFDYQPSGRFTFAIHGMSFTGVRQTWSDGRRKRIEDKLGSVVLGLEEASRVAREERLRREDAERRAEEERRLAAAERARREAEARRVAELRDQALLWEEADRLRRFLAAVETRVREGAGDDRTREWLAWAKRVAEDLDPIGRR
jgi:hypothetical protein